VRATGARRLCGTGVRDVKHALYPHLLALHDLADGAALPDAHGRVVVPAQLRTAGRSRTTLAPSLRAATRGPTTSTRPTCTARSRNLSVCIIRRPGRCAVHVAMISRRTSPALREGTRVNRTALTGAPRCMELEIAFSGNCPSSIHPAAPAKSPLLPPRPTSSCPRIIALVSQLRSAGTTS
jgi:hypothetical protein